MKSFLQKAILGILVSVAFAAVVAVAAVCRRQRWVDVYRRDGERLWEVAKAVAFVAGLAVFAVFMYFNN